MKRADLKAFLDEKVELHNQGHFLADDPIGIPHRFSKKEDIEISAFLAATIAWGQRVTIIRNANRLMEWMDESPYDFIRNHSATDLKPFEAFKHRTFNGDDILYFISALHHIYLQPNGMEGVFSQGFKLGGAAESISQFRSVFFEREHLPRTQKHVSNPLKGSSAKRLNMFLRWMVRQDNNGVDFGIWKAISPADLMLPLDIHTGNVSRKLGLLKRTQNDWKAVDKVTRALRKLDPKDPVKYDFALFGLGAIEGFK